MFYRVENPIKHSCSFFKHYMKGHSDLSVVVCVVVWSACGQIADGGRGLLLVVSCEKVLQILAGLRDGASDHVMGEGKTS